MQDARALIVLAEVPTIRRILLLTPGFPPTRGGIERTAGELATVLSRDYAVSVVAGRPTPDGSGTSPPRAPSVHWMPNRPPYGRRATAALIAGSVAIGLRVRPDVVLCLHIRGMPAARVIQRTTNARAILVVHAREISEQPRLARASVQWADGTVAVSEFSHGLALAVGSPAERTTIINPGVTLPLGDVVPVRDRQGPTRILAVARMADRHKGLDLLIEALRILRTRDQDLRAVLIGDGPLRAGLEQLAADCGVHDLITFMGAVDDWELRAQLARAHIFCLPIRPPSAGSVGEGFGISLVEASAYGLPVVAGRVPGVIDAVEDGVTGILVEPGAAAAVAAAIERLVAHPSLGTKMGEAGRQRAARLAWPEVVGRYIEWCRYIATLPPRRDRGAGGGWLLDLASGPIVVA